LLAFNQKRLGVEQYYYWQQKTVNTIVPKVYYQSPKNWYGEMRYNYEEVQTASIHFGKKFAFKKIAALEIVPVGGIIFGKLNGGSAGVITEANVLSRNMCFHSSEKKPIIFIPGLKYPMKYFLFFMPD
jgi:hypothetical protein